MRAPRAVVAACLVAVTAVAAAGCSDGGGTGSASTPTAAASPPDVRPPDLKRWQRDLAAVNCYAGTPDGRPGAETEEAIRSFQTASGITPDGTLDAETEKALEAAADAGRRVCVAPAGAGGTDASASLNAAGYGATFAIRSCSVVAARRQVSIRAEAPDSTLTATASGGVGTLSVAGRGGATTTVGLSGDITGVTVAPDRSFTLTGRLAGGDLSGEEFTLSGSCPD